jgi:hypothetical protein
MIIPSISDHTPHHLQLPRVEDVSFCRAMTSLTLVETEGSMVKVLSILVKYYKK